MKKNILNTVHETAKKLHEAELLDVTTMRTFDSLCLKAAKKMPNKETIEAMEDVDNEIGLKKFKNAQDMLNDLDSPSD